MPNTWSELNSFYLILGIIGIPLLLGFLTEAGKDLYNKITKKPTAEDMYAKCKEARMNCQKELLDLHKLDNYMLERQNRLREDRLPGIETQLKLLIEKQQTANNILIDLQRKFELQETRGQ